MNRRDGHGYGDGSSIFAETHGFEMLHALAAFEAIQDLRFFIEAIRRKKNGDRLADHLLGGVAEYPLGGLVPASDDAVQVFADNRVIGRSNDGGKQGLCFFGRIQRRYAKSAHRLITGNQRNVDGTTTPAILSVF